MLINNEEKFNALLEAAVDQAFHGWSFSHLRGRWIKQSLPWRYMDVVRERIVETVSMLDMGIGGGEFLVSLPRLPEVTVATEARAQNVAIARERLEPRGVRVIETESHQKLPFPPMQFELVTCRHSAYNPEEVYRVLRPGGVFITQQVGNRNNFRLNELVAGGKAPESDFEAQAAALLRAGFTLSQKREAYPQAIFRDIGAVVFYLTVIEWQILDFDVDKYRAQLGQIHNMMEKDGYLMTNEHRILFMAMK